MEKWKVIKYGDGFAVQTPDPNPESTDIYNVAGELIVRQDKAGIYGSELSEKDANLISAASELRDAVRAILFQVYQGKVLERDACITQAQAAFAKAEGKKS